MLKKVFSYLFVFLLPTLLMAQNRLVVPFVGSWNFGISSIRLSSETLSPGQRLDIYLDIRCIESTDNTGYIRVVVHVRGSGVQSYSDYRDINLIPTGNSKTLQFIYTPNITGAYNIIAEIWGGLGFSWCFVRKSSIFTVSESSVPQWALSVPSGLRLRQPYKEGSFTVFTFELDPAAVNKAANNYSVAEHYVRFMTWTVARDRWSSIDPIIMASIGITIGIRSQELYNQVRQHRGETIQMQFWCDDTVLPFIEVLRALELILGSVKILYGALLIHHLPFVSIR